MTERPVTEKTIPSLSEDDGLDLLDLRGVVREQRTLIVSAVVTTTLVALLISLALPKKYLAEASILPTAQSDAAGALATGLATQLGAAAGMLGGLGLGAGKSADLVEILSSRSMANRIITKYHLDRELKGWKTHNDLVKKVTKMTTIVPPSLKSKIINIKVQAPSGTLAATIADAYATELKGMLDEMGYNSAARNRKFIERQLAEAKNELALAEERFSRFQVDSHLASLPDTVTAAIKSISELEAKRVEAEVQLRTTDEALGAFKSKVTTLQADPGRLIDLEIKQTTLAAQADALTQAKASFIKELNALPPKGMALARLQRDVHVQNAIYLALRQQYQTAIISENKDSDAFLQLDKAAVPDKPSSPNTLLNVLLGLVSGLVGGLSLAIARSYFSKRRPQHGNY